MYTLGHHNNVYQSTQVIINTVSIQIDIAIYTLGHHTNVYPGYTRYNVHS